MAAVAPLETTSPPEQRLLLHGISWRDYVVLRDLLDGPSPKMTYVAGALELMSPSSEHELWKKNIARFVEHFAFVRGIELYGYGGTTFKKATAERGAEPDECYVIGKELVEYPEIVLEVIHTSPLLDKLDVYRAFGVAEVWVFRNRTFTIHVLDPTSARYEVRAASQLVPSLDFEVLARYAVRTDVPRALREFDQEIRRT